MKFPITSLGLLVVLIILPSLGAGLSAFAPTGLPSAGAERQANPSGEASKKELRITDPEGDVWIQPAEGAPSPVAEAVDITEVRVYGETGEVVQISVKFKDIQADLNSPSKSAFTMATGAYNIYVCFTLGDKHYAVWSRYKIVDLGPLAFTIGFRDGDGDKNADDKCPLTGFELIKAYGGGVDGVVNAAESRLDLTIRRTAFASLSESAPPGIGERITNVKVIARDNDHKARLAGTVERGLRFDAAPNVDPSTDVLPFVYPTSNQELKMGPDVARPIYRKCGDSPLLPAYEIEAGGMRGVPVALFNHGGSDRVVNFEVIKDGAPSWGARIMPSIGISAGTSDEASNLTVNVIVQTPAGTKHKDCATLRVRAVDSARSDVVGETSMNVLAVVAPTPQRNKFFAHSSGTKHWLNLEAGDPDDVKAPIYFAGTTSEGILGPTTPSNIEGAVSIEADAKSIYDLVVNTSAAHKNAQVTLSLISENFPTRAQLTLTLMSSGHESEILGSVTSIVSLPQSATEVKLDVPIQYTRDEFPDGDPSRIINARDHVRIHVNYVPLGPDDNTDQIRLTGRVAILPEGTTVTVPIWQTIKRNLNEPGASGAFITLKSFSPADAFANPGAMRVFNFTVQNEGAATDVAVIGTTFSGLTGHNWTAIVEPSGPFELAPGTSQAFSVGVTPPVGIRESESVLLDVSASSQSDPSARGTTAIRIVATQGQALNVENLADLDVAAKKKGFLPGVPALAVVVVLAALAWAGRRKD